MLHPDTGTLLTDYFDHPVWAGGDVVYPTKTGSSAASLTRARVVEIIPLVSYFKEFVRADHLHKADPTRYDVHLKDWDTREPDMSKAYILKVRTKDAWEVADDGYSKRPAYMRNVQWCIAVMS